MGVGVVMSAGFGESATEASGPGGLLDSTLPEQAANANVQRKRMAKENLLLINGNKLSFQTTKFAPECPRAFGKPNSGG